jgi:hypothetical protein
MYDLYTKETRFNLQENSTNFEKKYVFLAEQLNRKSVEALVKGFSDIRLGYSRYDYVGASLRRRLRRCVDSPSGTWAPIWQGIPDFRLQRRMSNTARYRHQILTKTRTC